MPKAVNNVDLNQNEIQNARIQNLATAPSSPVVGQVYFDTALGYQRTWNGSAWQRGSYTSDVYARVNHTGTQTAATVSDFDTQVRASRLDQMAVPTADVSFNSRKITNLNTPSADNDAATKAYVDAARSGLDVKQSVDASSTANVAGTYAATGGTSGRGQFTAMPNTIDGVTLTANDRVLLKDQSTAAQNGIWTVTTLGTGANGVWDRASDFDTDTEVTSGAFVFISEGTVNADTGWSLTTNDPIIIGGASGTSLAFAQFSSTGQIAAGAGLTKTGNTLDVGQGSGISVGADSIAIDTAVVVRKYAVAIGDGSAVSYAVTHNLGTRDITVGVYSSTTPWGEVLADIEHTDTNTVTIRFATAPTSGQYRVVVQA